MESENNLSNDGNAWVYGNAMVFGNARVSDDAWVFGDARVYGDEDYICVKGIGSEYRNTTFFKNANSGIQVNCGCFFGTLSEFIDAVNKTHGDNRYAKEYLATIKMVKIHFEIEDE